MRQADGGGPEEAATSAEWLLWRD